MTLNPIGANQNEVQIGRYRILFSYLTPVCVITTDHHYYKTNQFFSRTTSKHINSFLDGRTAEEKPQSWFDDLIK